METATLQLPKDLIDGAVKHHIALAMTEALGCQATILEKAVQQVLNQRVDVEGKVSSYNGDNRFTFIEAMVNKALRAAVAEALSEELGKHKDAIKKSIAAELSKSKSKLTQHLIETMTSSLVSAASDRYRLTISLEGK